MEKQRIKDLYNFYGRCLLDDCIPFWMKNGIDKKYGGFFTCLDRRGDVYNTDKSVWFQGRTAWMFSRLYNTLEKREEWLAAAKSAYDFLKGCCFDKDGRMFFTVTQEGRPLQKRRYMFSETFAVIAFAEYSKASEDINALNKAREVFAMLMNLYRNPGMLIPKINPEVRAMKSLALPMILLATTQSLREIDKDGEYDTAAKEFADVILKDFFKPAEKALFETVGINGERLDIPAGRCINPGYSIEAAWFLMHEGMYRNDTDIVQKALQILEYSLDIGWDKTYGGIYYFADIEGKPTEQLEWDMKLWWPHTEALYALLLAYCMIVLSNL